MKTSSLVSIAGLSFFVAACGKPCAGDACGTTDTSNKRMPVAHSAITTTDGPSGNLLTLASPSGRLEAPWDGANNDLLRIAATRTPGSAVVQAAIIEVTTPCDGGGTVTDTQDNVPPPWYSEGDSYTTTYAACVVGDTQTDGSQSYSVDVLQGQPYIDVSWSSGTTIARDLTRTNLVTGDVSYAIGSMSESLTVVDNIQFTQVTAGESNRNWFNNGVEQVGVESYNVTYAWDENTQIFQWDFVVSSTNMALGDSSAQTVTTLTGTIGQPPEQGSFTTSKTSFGTTTTSTITAIGGGNVLVETDSDGNGVIDLTSETTWNQLILDAPLNQFI